MDSELGPVPFSMDDLIQKARGGLYPDGYLEAYLAHLRRSHAVARAEIERCYAEAAADPVKWARLRDARF